MKKDLLFLFLLCNLHLSAQWQYLPGPDGGRIVNIEADGNVLYALTETQIYRSLDQGYHWQKIPGARRGLINKLTAENGIFYGIDIDGELSRSSDMGRTWQPVLKKPFPVAGEGEVLIDVFAKGDTLLISSTSTVYRSVDQGDSWLPTGDSFAINQTRIFSTGTEFFLWGGDQIHRSSDGGLSWDRVGIPPGNLAMVSAAGDAQYILYANLMQLVRSKDGFRTWETIDTDSILPVLIPPHEILKLVEIRDTLYYFARARQAGCSSRVCYSTDQGSSWHAGNGGNSLPVNIDDIVSFGNHLVFVDRIRGIVHTTNGCKNFTSEQQGLDATFIESIFSNNKNVFVAGNDAIYYSGNNGISWKEIVLNGFPISCSRSFRIFSTDQRLYWANQSNDKFYSEDEGASWQPLQMEGFYLAGTTQNSIWGHDFNQTLYRVSDSGIASSINWQDYLRGEKITSLTTSANHILLTTDARHYLLLNEQGTLLRKIPFSPCDPLSPVEKLHYDGQNVFHFCGQNTYVSKKETPEWQPIYPQDWTTGILLYHNYLNYITTYKGVTFIALQNKGIFYTTDATGRFYPLQPQFPNRYPQSIGFKGNSIWVSLSEGGIYTLELPLFQSDVSAKPVFQHSPTPSDGHLNLQSNVFFTDEIQLDVLDMTGRLSVSTRLHPGQTWELDFPTLSKGLYVLMLRTPLGNTALKWSVMK